MLKMFFNINLMNDSKELKTIFNNKSELYLLSNNESNLFNLNKSKVIDYIICLKLIIKKINIEMPNIFYKEWISYLLPSFNNYNNYNNYNNIIMNSNIFISSYNLNNKLLHKLNKEYYSKNHYSNPDITVNIKKDKIFRENKNIILIDIYFHKYYYILNFKIKYIIDKFMFEFPINILKMILINKNNIDFNYFNDLINLIWTDNSTMLMDDYIYCSAFKKIVYYDLFKKIILRNIDNLIN
jgi:hypothetical protein